MHNKIICDKNIFLFSDTCTTLNNLHKKLAHTIVVDYGKIEIKEETLATLIKLLCTIYG